MPRLESLRKIENNYRYYTGHFAGAFFNRKSNLQEVRRMQVNEKIALDVAEAAELLGVSRPTMYNICNRSDFTATFKIGSRTKISREGLIEWVRRQTDDAGTKYAN